MKRLLTTVSAIATLAIPAASFAHAYQDQDAARPDRAAAARNRQPAARNAQPTRQNTAPAAARDQRPNQRPAEQRRPAPGPDRRDVQIAPERARQDWRTDQRQRVNPQSRENWRADQRQRINPQPRVAQRQGWNRDNRTWWRGRSGFQGYQGRRTGYWYTPGRGYYRVDPRWYGYSWRIGGYVPWEFRNYYVQDPYLYGLPPAPYGYAYVYLDNNVALMSLATGLIVQVFSDLY